MRVDQRAMVIDTPTYSLELPIPMTTFWTWLSIIGLSMTPNLVLGSNVQVVWEKFCRYFDVEPRIVRMQAEEKVPYIAPGLDPMTLRAGQDRAQHRRPRPRGLAAQEEPVLSADRLVSKRSFAHVIVDRQTTVFRVATQRLPLVSCVGDHCRRFPSPTSRSNRSKCPDLRGFAASF